VVYVRAILHRLALSLVTLLLVSAFIFFVTDILPGDVAIRILGREATPEALAVLREQLNLSAPVGERFLSWLNQMAHGDFGVAMSSRKLVIEVLAPRLFNTMLLSLFAFLIYVPLSVVPAILQALKRDRGLDTAISVVTIILLSTPDFLLATYILLIFAVILPIFPPTAMLYPEMSWKDELYAMFMPALTLGILMATYAVRMLRDSLIEVLDSDYIRMAELKGLRRRRIMMRHALPNALVPTLNVTALNLAYLIAGVVIVERVFVFPGFGSILVDALLWRDIPLVQATTLISAAIYIGGNLLADLGAIALNPKLRDSLA
jgi:peptide/nickel transport system permease protein